MMDINTIRQMAREQGVDLEIQGLVCLPWELRKYTGSITRRQNKGGMAYVALIKHKISISQRASILRLRQSSIYVSQMSEKASLLKTGSLCLPIEWRWSLQGVNS